MIDIIRSSECIIQSCIQLLPDSGFSSKSTGYGDIYQIGITTITFDDILNKNWNWSKRIYPFLNIKNKNAVIFPKKIKNSYVLLHRIEPFDKDWEKREHSGGKILLLRQYRFPLKKQIQKFFNSNYLIHLNSNCYWILLNSRNHISILLRVILYIFLTVLF